MRCVSRAVRTSFPVAHQSNPLRHPCLERSVRASGIRRRVRYELKHSSDGRCCTLLRTERRYKRSRVGMYRGATKLRPVSMSPLMMSWTPLITALKRPKKVPFGNIKMASSWTRTDHIGAHKSALSSRAARRGALFYRRTRNLYLRGNLTSRKLQ